MHSHTLGIVTVGETQKDPEMDRKIAEEIAALKLRQEDGISSIFTKLYISRLKNLQSAFAREVVRQTDALMEPYSANTENPAYLAFEDYTDELRDSFEENVPCIQTPDGRLQEYACRSLRDLVIKDGKVCSRSAGQLKHTKRTRKSRKYKALPSCPRKKIYKSFENYAEKSGYTPCDDQPGRYGYYTNPDAMWDWFVLGGRWPTTFLVKDDCTEYAVGENNHWGKDNSLPVPAGYRWVSAARKKDIQWDQIRKWRTAQITERFHAMEAAFAKGVIPPESDLRLREDGIYGFDGCVYSAGETLETYLAKYDYPDTCKYPVSFSDIVTCDGWESEEYRYSGRKNAPEVDSFQRTIDSLIDDCDDDDVIVSIDYHI